MLNPARLELGHTVGEALELAHANGVAITDQITCLLSYLDLISANRPDTRAGCDASQQEQRPDDDV